MQRPVSEITEKTTTGSQGRRLYSYGEPRPELQEALQVLGQRKWSILLITLLMAGLALLVSSRQTPIYESRASVLVAPITDPRTEQPVQPNLATEVEVASSVAVARVVIDKLEVRAEPEDLLGGLGADSPPDTEILQLSFRDPDPGRAQRFAQAFAESYLEYRQDTVSQTLVQSAEEIEEELNVLNERLTEVENQLSSLADDDPRRGPLESQASLLNSLILERRLNQVDLGDAAQVGSVVQPATAPGGPVSPNHLLNLGFGLVAGLALGIGLAFLRDRLSGRLTSEDEVQSYFAAPVLGRIPRVSSWRKRRKAYLVTRSEWGSPAAEAFRMLRTNLLSIVSMYGGVKSLLVTSAHVGEGKTSVAGNLAIALARAGKKVILVSADLRRPRLQEFFPRARSVGLTEVLAGGVELDTALEPAHIAVPGAAERENLWVLYSGMISESPSEVLSSERMTSLLDQLRSRADIVLIDAPPVLPVTDAMVLAPSVDGVLFVIGPGSATRSTLISARQQLENVGARVLGTVVNGVFGLGHIYYNY